MRYLLLLLCFALAGCITYTPAGAQQPTPTTGGPKAILAPTSALPAATARPTATALTAPPTATALPSATPVPTSVLSPTVSLSADLSSVITVKETGIEPDKDVVYIFASVTNADNRPHQVNVQANVYDKPLSAIDENDPNPDDMITAGSVDLTLAPHQQKNVEITAKNVLNIPPISADFRVIGH